MTRRTANKITNESSIRTVETRCERTFITFENDIDEKAFDNVFPSQVVPVKRSQICAITRYITIQLLLIKCTIFNLFLDCRRDISIQSLNCHTVMPKLSKFFGNLTINNWKKKET